MALPIDKSRTLQPTSTSCIQAIAVTNL